jgi:hypothetical protein
MLPYPGIPYGTAPAWSFPAFEISQFLLLAFCFGHAIVRRRQAVPYIVGGFVFGVLLEYMEVVSHSYTYGRFFLRSQDGTHERRYTKSLSFRTNTGWHDCRSRRRATYSSIWKATRSWATGKGTGCVAPMTRRSGRLRGLSCRRG